MSKKAVKKERAMKTDKIRLEVQGPGTLWNYEVANYFTNAFSRNADTSEEGLRTFLRVGDRSSEILVPIMMMAMPGTGDDSIRPIDEAAFAGEAQTRRREYQSIGHGEVRGIFRERKRNYTNPARLDLPNEEGSYVMTFGGIPRFVIDVEPHEGCITGPMTFREHGRDNSTFSYIPRLDARPMVIDLEATVVARARNPEEIRTRKIFLQAAAALVKYHTDRAGAEIVSAPEE